MRWKDGSTYEGEFYNNHIGIDFLKNFQREEEHIDGQMADFLWVNGSITKFMERESSNGRMVVNIQVRVYFECLGAYINDKKEGYGEFFWPDGRVFKGQWLNGKQNGHGVMTDSTGRRQEGKRS